MRKEPRLHFTKEEREDPALEKPIRRTDRAAARADKAQAKLPKQRIKQRTVNPETGAVTVRLRFEDKKPPSKLYHTLQDASADTVLSVAHREINEAQEENVGVEAAHKSEQAAETAGRLVREGYCILFCVFLRRRRWRRRFHLSLPRRGHAGGRGRLRRDGGGSASLPGQL